MIPCLIFWLMLENLTLSSFHENVKKLLVGYLDSSRVDEENEKRPDYLLKKNGGICIAEVKEFIANDDEKRQ